MSKTELFRPRRFENSEGAETRASSTDSPEQEEAAEDAPFNSSLEEFPDEAEPLDRVLAKLFQLDSAPEAPAVQRQPLTSRSIPQSIAFLRICSIVMFRESRHRGDFQQKRLG